MGGGALDLFARRGGARGFAVSAVRSRTIRSVVRTGDGTPIRTGARGVGAEHMSQWPQTV